MTKILRTHIEGALFYVTARGDNDENIFAGVEDYSAWLELLKKYKEQYGFKLFSFVLMPNHLHLLVELKQGLTISDIMHDLDSNYTKYFNAKYRRKGHLFQERYKLVLLEKENYLLDAGAYIHLNPLKLGLVENLADYPYSSYLYYVDRRTEGLKNRRTQDLDLGEELRAIQERLGKRSYEEFLRSVTKEDMELLAAQLARQAVLGSADFLEKVKTLVGQVKEQETESREQGSRDRVRRRRFVMAGSVLVLLLGALNLYLYAETLGLKTHFTKQLEEEKVRVSKGLNEEYRGQINDYYKDIGKKLQMEKQKTRALEERLMKGQTDREQGEAR